MDRLMEIKVKLKHVLGNSILFHLGKSDAGLICYQDLDRIFSSSQPDLAQKVQEHLQHYFGPKLWQKGLSEKLITCLAQNIVLRKTGQLDEKLAEELHSLIPGLDESRLSPRTWLALEVQATASGLYRAGYELRKIALKSIYATAGLAQLKRQKSKLLFRAAVDQSDPMTADKAFSRYLSFEKNNQRADLARFYHDMSRGDRASMLEIARRYYSDIDRQFAQFIDGKRVAIVGPAPNDEDSAQEIDQFDVVIRLNYRGPQSLPPAEQYGSKMDISYYNGDNAKGILKANDFSFVNDLQFAVFKSVRYAYSPPLLRTGTPATRAMFSPHQFWFYGTPTMIPNVLFDLLHFNPATIKLFKANFFYTKTLYYKGYSTVDHSLSHFSKVWYNHAKHNLISQLNFTRMLVQNGLVETDQTCRAVLDLDNQDYISGMEQLFVIDPIERAAKANH